MDIPKNSHLKKAPCFSAVFGPNLTFWVNKKHKSPDFYQNWPDNVNISKKLDAKICSNITPMIQGTFDCEYPTLILNLNLERKKVWERERERARKLMIKWNYFCRMVDQKSLINLTVRKKYQLGPFSDGCTTADPNSSYAGFKFMRNRSSSLNTNVVYRWRHGTKID